MRNNQQKKAVEKLESCLKNRATNLDRICADYFFAWKDIDDKKHL